MPLYATTIKFVFLAGGNDRISMASRRAVRACRVAAAAVVRMCRPSSVVSAPCHNDVIIGLLAAFSNGDNLADHTVTQYDWLLASS